MENKFEYAIKNKLRFQHRGVLTVEDLYDLTMGQLDGLFKTLNKEAKTLRDEESLMDSSTGVPQSLEVKIEIVKHIFNEKQEEKKLAELSKFKADERQRLLELKAKKMQEADGDLSIEEIDAKLEAL